MESDSTQPAFKRVLIKLSGEALMGPTDYGIHTPTVQTICQEIVDLKELGTEIGLVVGGGNVFRRRPADRGTGRGDRG